MNKTIDIGEILQICLKMTVKFFGLQDWYALQLSTVGGNCIFEKMQNKFSN